MEKSIRGENSNKEILLKKVEIFLQNGKEVYDFAENLEAKKRITIL